MKADLDQLYKENSKGDLVPTWRYYLGMFLGSIKGSDYSHMVNDTFPFMDSICQLCHKEKDSSQINTYIPKGGLGDDDLKDRDKHEIICTSCTKRYFKLRDKASGPLFISCPECNNIVDNTLAFELRGMCPICWRDKS